MKNNHFLPLFTFVLGISMMILVGCGARTAPSKFYTLHSLAASEAKQQAGVTKQDIAVGIGPIEFPKYLDRPQIVTRISKNRLKLDDFNRWAEPLEFSFSRVLAENLSTLLSTDHIAFYPWKSSLKIKYQLMVDVTHFDGTLGEDVTFRAHWTLFDEEKKKVLSIRKSTFSEPTDGRDYESLASAKSRVLANFSKEIAEAIKTVSQEIPKQ
jgi:uncharacterized lipoprotein YmbA